MGISLQLVAQQPVTLNILSLTEDLDCALRQAANLFFFIIIFIW